MSRIIEKKRGKSHDGFGAEETIAVSGGARLSYARTEGMSKGAGIYGKARRRIFAIALSVALVFGLAPVSAFAASTTAPTISNVIYLSFSGAATYVNFNSDQDGTYFYQLDGTAPSTAESLVATASNSGTLTEGANSFNFNVTAAAHTVYVTAKNAGGSIGSLTTVNIPKPTGLSALSNTAGSSVRIDKTTGVFTVSASSAGTIFYQVASSKTTLNGNTILGGMLNSTPLKAGANKINVSGITDDGIQKGYAYWTNSGANESGQLGSSPVIWFPAYDPPVLSAATSQKTSATAGTISFSSSKAGTYYYQVDGTAPTAYSLYSAGTGSTTMASGSNSFNLTTDSNAHKVYIVAKCDADEGTVLSSLTTLDIPAYNPPKLSSAGYYRFGDSVATVFFSSNAEGTYYYQVNGTAPTAEGLVSAGTNSSTMVNGSNNFDVTNLSASVSRTVYIAAKGADGQVSDLTTLTIGASSANPSLTYGLLLRDSNDTASMTFKSNMEGTYYWQLDGDPTNKSLVMAGTNATALVASTNSISLTGLGSGIHTLYIASKSGTATESGTVRDPYNAGTPYSFQFNTFNPPVISSATAQRTSDTAATVNFSGSMKIYCYYQVDGVAPTSTSLVQAGSNQTTMEKGDNSISLPIDSKAHKVYIAATNYKATAYAYDVSSLVTLDIPAYNPPALSSAIALRQSDTAATVSFSSTVAGTYYYQLDGTAPTAAGLISAGTNSKTMANGANSFDLTVTAGARKVYIAAKNGDGQASALTTLDIAAYSAPALTAGTAVRNGSATAAVSFSSNAAGTYYYQVDGTAPSAKSLSNAGTNAKTMANSSNSISLSGLAAGAHTVYITGRSGASTASGSVSGLLTMAVPEYDSTPPVLSGAQATRSSSSAGKVTFTSNEAGTYYYQIDGTAPTAANLAAAGTGQTAMVASTNTIDMSGLSDGAHSLYIAAKDATGNVCSLFTVTLPAYDGTAPALTLGKITRTSDVKASVGFSSDEAGTYYFQLDGAAPTAANLVADGTNASSMSAASYTIDFAGLSAGAHMLYITAKDATGNVSKLLSVTIPEYDTTPPTIVSKSIERVSTDYAVVGFTSNEAGSYYYQIDGTAPTAAKLAEAGTNETDLLASENSIDLVGISSGTHIVYIAAKDVAGNVSSLLKVVVPAATAPDTTAPVLTAGTVSRGGETTATVKFSSDETGAYYCQVDGNAPTAATLTSSGTGNAMSASVNTVEIAQINGGGHTVYIAAKDAAGNVSNLLAMTIPIYDMTPPTLAEVSIERSGDAGATVNFASNEAGTYYYQIDGAAPTSEGLAAGGLNEASLVASVNAIELSGLAAGEHIIYVAAKDGAGNVSGLLTVSIPAYSQSGAGGPGPAPDHDSPTLILSAGLTSRISSGEAQVHFTSNEAGVYYYIVRDTPPTTAEIAGTDGSYGIMAASANTITIDGLESGAHTIYILGKDKAGGKSNMLALKITAYDAAPPEITGLTADRKSDMVAEVSFTSDEAGSYYYQLDGAEPAVAALAADGTKAKEMKASANIIQLADLSAGAHRIYIAAKDMAGNVSALAAADIPAYDPSGIGMEEEENNAPVDELEGSDDFQIVSTPQLSSGTGVRTSNNTATLFFLSNTAGTCYYNMDNKGVSADGLVAAGDGATPIVKGVNIIELDSISPVAHTVNLAAKNAEDEISNMLTMQVDIYKLDKTPPVLSGGVGIRDEEGDGATVYFKSNEAGMSYYQIDGETPTAGGLAAPESSSAAIVAAANSIAIDSLPAGGHKVYVAAKDPAGNVSNLLTVNFPGVNPEADKDKELPAATKDQFTFSPAAVTYNGSAQGVDVTPKVGVGKATVYYTGVNGTNYAKSASKPVNAGTYAITVDTAAGTAYKATSDINLGTFTINKADISKMAVTVADSVWTGAQIKPAAFTANGKAYAIGQGVATGAYGANVAVGKGTVTLTGAGNYSGTKAVTFNINPQAGAVSKVTAGKGQIKVTWKKAAAKMKVTNYQVRYRVKGTAAWKTKSFTAKKASATFKKLKKGKAYEVQIQSCVKASGSTYYSAWSPVKASNKVK